MMKTKEQISRGRRPGFTIIELLGVITIIGILMGIVTTAASNSLKASRSKRAAAACKIVQAGFATYYARYGRWPDPLGSDVANGFTAETNEEGPNRTSDPNKHVIKNASDVQRMVKALVDEAKEGRPVMDISGLFVSLDQGNPGGKGSGLDFLSAIHGTRWSKRKWKTSEMHFGYPDTGTGRFRRFKLVYSIPTDQLTVTTWE